MLSATAAGTQPGSPVRSPDHLHRSVARQFLHGVSNMLITLAASRPRPCRRGLHRPLTAVAAWLGRALANELAIRRSIHELAFISDRELHDLGLSRCEIEHVTRHGRL